MAVENALQVSMYAAGSMEDMINQYYDGLITKREMADKVAHELFDDLMVPKHEPVMIKIFKKGINDR